MLWPSVQIHIAEEMKQRDYETASTTSCVDVRLLEDAGLDKIGENMIDIVSRTVHTHRDKRGHQLTFAVL